MICSVVFGWAGDVGIWDLRKEEGEREREGEKERRGVGEMVNII